MRSRVSIRRWAIVAIAAAVGVLAWSVAATGQETVFDDTSRVVVTERGPGGKPRECSVVLTLPVRGGCQMDVSGKALFKILTPFGRLRFSECDFEYSAHIESNGEVALDEIEISGGTEGTDVCGDIRACREDTELERRPWLGMIKTDKNSFAMDLEACLDTCAGWFEGPLRLEFDRVAGGWRLHGERVEIGETGIEITGSWKFEQAGLDVKEDDS